MYLNQYDRSVTKSSSGKLLISACVVLALVGCGKKEEAKQASQVAAKVNADEITVSQISYVLSRAQNQNLSSEAAEKAKSEVLEKLIDQELAKQQAIAMKLDRTPAVVQAIEAARNEILSRAYYEKIASALPKPSDDEIKKYYAAHPELFAERRVYSLEEIAMEPKEGIADALSAEIAGAKSMQDIAAWLRQQDIKFSGNRGVRGAEALPFELLPTLQGMKDGEIRLIQVNGRPTVFHLVASQKVPVDEATATPRIQQFLFNQKLTQSIATENKSLRDKADVTYVGDFAGGPAAAEARVKAQTDAIGARDAKIKADAEALAKANADASAKSSQEADARAKALAASRAEAGSRPADSKSTPAQLNQDHIEKGLGALK